MCLKSRSIEVTIIGDAASTPSIYVGTKNDSLGKAPNGYHERKCAHHFVGHMTGCHANAFEDSASAAQNRDRYSHPMTSAGGAGLLIARSSIRLLISAISSAKRPNDDMNPRKCLCGNANL